LEVRFLQICEWDRILPLDVPLSLKIFYFISGDRTLPIQDEFHDTCSCTINAELFFVRKCIYIFSEVLCQTTLTPTSSQTPYFQNNPTTYSSQDYDQTDVSSSQYNNQNSQQQLLNSNQNNQQSSQYPSQGSQQQYGNQVSQQQYPSEYNQNQIPNGAQDQYSASGNQQSILGDFGPTVSPDSQNFVVMNPNARFLPENLYDQYVTAYNQRKFYNPSKTLPFVFTSG
jgi:hypothetical protein